MIAPLAVLTVVVLGASTHTDTTFSVKPGSRLELSNFAGGIAVETWARNAVRVEAQHSPRAGVRIDDQSPTISIEIKHWRGIPTTVDYHLTVPRWMPLNLSGVNTEISVLGTEAEVDAQTVQGDVSITGGVRKVAAGSVEGAVKVSGARGKVECNSVNAGIQIENVTGAIAASTVNGEIVFEGVDSDDVEASTINGGVDFAGLIKDGGSYRFSTHNGSVVVTVPERANATVSVSTFSGEFSSAFPVQLNMPRRGKAYSFTLGNGSARLELESFQGEIQLRRPGDADGKSGSGYQYQYQQHKETQPQKRKRKNAADPADSHDQP